MLQFFYDYGLVLELFSALFIFTINLKKRSYCILRYLVLVFAIAFFCFLRAAFPLTTIYGKIFSYMILYVICFGLNYFIFDTSFRVIVYCTISGIIGQHISYVISDFVRSIVTSYSTLTMGNVAYTLITITIYALLFFFLSFKQEPRDFMKLDKEPIIMSTVIIFIICVIVLQIYEVYRENIIFPLHVVFVILDITCCMSIYLIQRISYISARNAIETEIIKNRLNQYESLQNVIDLMNIRIHDLKHQIHKLEKDNSTSPEVIKQLNDSISKYKSFSRCGNDIIDTILTEKNIRFEKEGIKFTYNINGKLFDHFSIQDINSIFGNAIDNALEYLMTMPSDKRFLSIRTTESGNLAKISFENTYQGKANFNKEGLLNTTKDNTFFHGFGLRSIRSTIKKYDGSMLLDVENDTFKLQLLFPKNTNNDIKESK